jgi:hypothetical protein
MNGPTPLSTESPTTISSSTPPRKIKNYKNLFFKERNQSKNGKPVDVAVGLSFSMWSITAATTGFTNRVVWTGYHLILLPMEMGKDCVR